MAHGLDCGIQVVTVILYIEVLYENQIFNFHPYFPNPRFSRNWNSKNLTVKIKIGFCRITIMTDTDLGTRCFRKEVNAQLP